MGFITKQGLEQTLSRWSAFIGLLLYSIGLIWFCLLSQDELNYETYMSENALLVGQVVEKFSDGAAVAKYESQLSSLYAKGDMVLLRNWLKSNLEDIGLEVYEQNFTFTHDILHPIEEVIGTNLYAIMRSPSGGRTEAILLTVPLRTECSAAVAPCLSPTVGLLIPLMKLLRQQVYWAKDIIVIFVDSDYIGLLAWLEAYHGAETSKYLSWSEIQGRSGNIQAGLNLEFSHSDPSSIDIIPEGTNGFLANLDLVNTVVRLAHKHAIDPIVNGQAFIYGRGHLDARKGDALGLLNAVWTQASGSPAGLHGLLINYQIPAVTLRGPSRKYPSFSGSQEITRLGKFIEGILRSLNNLQERLHQSFWYYLLANPMRYISIGVYMPSILILIGSLLIKTIGFWCASTESTDNDESKRTVEHTADDDDVSVPTPHDPDQQVRKRTKQLSKKDTSGAEKEASSSTVKAKPKRHRDGIPATLSRLAVWIVISFGCGLFLHISPKLIFYLYQHPKWETLQILMGYQPLISDFLALSMLCIFGVVTFVSPFVVGVIYRYCIAKLAQEGPWASSILLVSWTLFLTCMACLNVSASLLLSALVVPVLLMFVRVPNTPKLGSGLFGLFWILLSPPVLLILACYLHLSYFEEGMMTRANGVDFSELHSGVTRVLVQVLIEADLFGSWAWPVLTCGYSSLWMLTWNSIWCG